MTGRAGSEARKELVLCAYGGARPVLYIWSSGRMRSARRKRKDEATSAPDCANLPGRQREGGLLSPLLHWCCTFHQGMLCCVGCAGMVESYPPSDQP